MRSGRRIACLQRKRECGVARDESRPIPLSSQYSAVLHAFHPPLGILPSNTLQHSAVKGRYGFLFLFRFITPLLYTRTKTYTQVEQGHYENELNGVSRFVGWMDNV